MAARDDGADGAVASALFAQCLIKIIVALCRMHTKRTTIRVCSARKRRVQRFAHYASCLFYSFTFIHLKRRRNNC